MPYNQMIAGYAHTADVQITSISASGEAITVITRATETDGTVQKYRLSYLVSKGIITAGQSQLLGSG